MINAKFPLDRQLDMMDCGATCLKMVAKHYGKFYSLQYMRDKCGVTKEGVSFADISHAAEGIGLRSVALKCTIEELVHKIPLPAIVHWDNSHFVVVYKTKQMAHLLQQANLMKVDISHPHNLLPKSVSLGELNIKYYTYLSAAQQYRNYQLDGA